MNSEVTKDKLAADLRVVIDDAEELLKATASQAGDKVAAARVKIQESVGIGAAVGVIVGMLISRR